MFSALYIGAAPFTDVSEDSIPSIFRFEYEYVTQARIKSQARS
jgi:hypothetical protein